MALQLLMNYPMATGSKFCQLTHLRPALSRLFSKTSTQFDKTCREPNQECHRPPNRSNQYLKTGSTQHQQLKIFQSLKCSQPSIKFSTSAFNCIKRNEGNLIKSKISFFDFFSLRSLISTPAPYMLFGISGLIPFTSVPIYMFLTSTYYPILAQIQLVYGACILSFLGGVAWGNELKTPDKSNMKSLGYSISLPLIGWIGVLAYPSVNAFPIMISGIALAGYIDAKFQDYPQWFKNLRFLLSTLVLLSLISTLLFSVVYRDSEHKMNVEQD